MTLIRDCELAPESSRIAGDGLLCMHARESEMVSAGQCILVLELTRWCLQAQQMLGLELTRDCGLVPASLRITLNSKE